MCESICIPVIRRFVSFRHRDDPILAVFYTWIAGFAVCSLVVENVRHLFDSMVFPDPFELLPFPIGVCVLLSEQCTASVFGYCSFFVQLSFASEPGKSFVNVRSSCDVFVPDGPHLFYGAHLFVPSPGRFMLCQGSSQIFILSFRDDFAVEPMTFRHSSFP